MKIKQIFSWPLRHLPGRRILGRHYFQYGLEHQRSIALRMLLAESGPRVLDGPFSGMILSEETCWGDGDLLPKLLGAYESELHPWLTWLQSQSYDLAVDVGCAEGFYVTGLARMLPNCTRIVGFDINPEARRICRLNCELNDVSPRITLGGLCDPATLHGLLSTSRRPFLMVDCEGGERELLCENQDAELHKTDLLIECHDFLDRDITAKLKDRFSSTHRIQIVTETSRDFAKYPFLKKLGGLPRALALCESRPELMHWMLCTSNLGNPR